MKALNPHVVRFDFFPFEDGQIDQELPFIIAGMVVLSQNSLQGKEFAKTGLTPLMGSSPYRVKEVHPGQSITYERDPSYWGKDQPSLRGFCIILRRLHSNILATIRLDLRLSKQVW